MGNNELILIERERIKKIVEKKIDYIIWKREQMYSGKKTQRKDKRQLIPLFERLKEDILFQINNSNYKKKESCTKKEET